MKWERATTGPALASDEIHLWRIDLKAFRPNICEFQQVLSEGEANRAARFIRSEDRDRYVIARAAMRRLLSSYLQISASEIRFESNAFGKPSVSKSMNTEQLSFNLSHSGDLCLLGVRRGGEIGVDIERIRDDVKTEELARRFFSPQEISELDGLPEAARTLGFFLCWTRKEAYIKAHGSGLQHPLDQFAVTLTPGSTPELRSVDQDRWLMLSIDPEEGYVGSIVTERALLRLTFLDYI